MGREREKVSLSFNIFYNKEKYIIGFILKWPDQKYFRVNIAQIKMVVDTL